MIIRIVIVLLPILFFGQNSCEICGVWLEEKQESHIEIYQTKEETIEGKIIWLANPLNEDNVLILLED